MAQRYVLHLDFDAFFASVEEILDPSLKGKPIIVGAPPERRGVVASASYAARAFGVRASLKRRFEASSVTLSFVLKLRRQEINTLKGSLSEEFISSSQGTWKDITCLLSTGQILMNSFTVIQILY